MSARVQISHVLCPVDLSETSKRALSHGRALAAWYGADLTVLEVIWGGLPPMPFPNAAYGGPSVPILKPEERARFEADLAAFCGDLADSPRVHLRVAEGPVVPTIIDTARETGAGMIVMGTHGLSGVDRLLMGSMTDKVLRKSSCPVVTIPPTASILPEGARYGTIVCAMDFSPASHNALRYALSLAQETEATLLLAHVVEWPSDRPQARGADAGFREGLEKTALQDLESAVPAEARLWRTPEAIVRHGRAHEAIVTLAAERAADLIVLGVHGRSALNVAIFGSTANQVIRTATCPVLTVRS